MRTVRAGVFLTAFAVLVAMTAAAQARPIRIVAFGDSATAGWLVAHEHAYPAQLQELLRKKGYGVTVVNAGVNGDTSAGGLRRFDQAIAPGTDIAIVEFGVNDLRQHVPLQDIYANVNAIVATLRNRRIYVVLIGLGDKLDLSDVARNNSVPYVQWSLPPGKYRASDGAHFNAEGYAILLARTLPKLEVFVKRVADE